MNYNRAYALLGLAVADILALVLMVYAPTAQAALPQALATSYPNSYFPLQVRNQWVYSWTNNVYAISPISETVVVTEAVSSEYKLHAYNDKGADGQFTTSTATDYLWTWYGTMGWNPFPLPLHMVLMYLQVPPKMFPASFQDGDNWTGTGIIAGTVYTGTTTVITSAATVSAGGRTYNNALQIHTVITGPHPFGAGTRDTWFAPNVGLVRLVYNHNDGSVTTIELQNSSIVFPVFLPLVLRGD